MKSFIILHSITSPYRMHLFRVLSDELAERGVRLHVHFMTRSSGQRPRDWEATSAEIPFPHTFWRDAGPTVKGKTWHFNPGLLAELARRRSDYLLVGGPWDSLTGLGASFLARRDIGIGWGETNTRTPGRITGAVGALKRLVLSRYEVIAVPGAEGREHAAMLFGDRPVPADIVYLPNIVDETRFRPGGRPEDSESARRELGVASGERMALWPARLIANKGVVEFLSHITRSDLEGWRLVILGGGPLQAAVQDVIARRGLGDHVTLVQGIERGRMPAFYRAADLFVLPSLKDPNPLSVVEALHSGLPLLVSDRLGNFPEALHEGVNGWGLDPASDESVNGAVRAAFGSSVEQRRAMGARSLDIAQQQWDSRAAVRRFLDGIPVPRGVNGGG